MHVARELGRCRQRGIDDLDVTAHNKEPVETPELDQLAHDYHTATDRPIFGRVAEIRTLVRDGLAAYAEQGNEPESRFIASLFFDPSGAAPKSSPGALLETAQQASGIVDPKQFAEYRRDHFVRFAEFLIAFVAARASTAAETARVLPTHDAHEAQENPAYPPVSEADTGAAGTGRTVGDGPARHWPSLADWRGQRRELVAAVVLGLALLVTLVVGLTHTTTNQPTAAGTGSSAGTLRSSAAGSIATVPPGRTYTEMTGEFGAPTFTDPRHPAVTGVRIQPYETVQVACKVYAPTIPSASPDGYWYRIATAPWNGRYYAVANTFMNGDKIGAPATHNTDFAVPNCS
jgi:hypothetical protein